MKSGAYVKDCIDSTKETIERNHGGIIGRSFVRGLGVRDCVGIKACPPVLRP